MNNYYINQPPFPFGEGGRGFGPGRPDGPGSPFGPSFPPGFPPGQPGPGAGAPTTPPPSTVPRRPTGVGQPGQPGLFFVDPGAIRQCLYQFVYIWLVNGQQFWVWLVFVGPNSIAGYRWTGFRWVYFGTDLRNIDTFVCY
ncbi:hypothetical protein [Petroclostridium sp. X23]|uniref:hypothetical protein n=1 Tax=Petroclostridium sp. X23 TaxID=3045146 RepID=UPI0024AE403A|nr:hypothetical protein [Petroclostridium sp. X23]WHH58532.1 hypothetical protein QKW49_22490 [Petroclostridium sp. X23]